MSKAAPQQRRKIATARSSRSLGRARDARCGANPGFRRRDEELFADYPPVDSSPAGDRSSLLDMVAYVIHGFALLFLSLWALYYFGQVFWFFSTVMAAVGMFSLYDACAGHRRPGT